VEATYAGSEVPKSGDKVMRLPKQPRGEGRASVLVVDDEVSVRDFIGSVLQRKGYLVERPKYRKVRSSSFGTPFQMAATNFWNAPAASGRSSPPLRPGAWQSADRSAHAAAARLPGPG
jgi:hypothetical protein